MATLNSGTLSTTNIIIANGIPAIRFYTSRPGLVIPVTIVTPKESWSTS